jgi:hypothetical protein
MQTEESAVYEIINEAKLKYTTDTVRPTRCYIGHGTDSPCCSVFFCGKLAEQEYTFNSLPYCRGHVGVALLNARRHNCNYCLMMNVIIIRDSPKDTDHVDATRYNVSVPVQLGGGQEYSIKQFCIPVVPPGSLTLDRNTTEKGYSYVDHYFGYQNRRSVPTDAFVWITPRKEVVAWVLMRRMMGDKGSWSTVTDRQQFLGLMQHRAAAERQPPCLRRR